jgi:hypothetical protein
MRPKISSTLDERYFAVEDFAELYAGAMRCFEILILCAGLIPCSDRSFSDQFTLSILLNERFVVAP